MSRNHCDITLREYVDHMYLELTKRQDAANAFFLNILKEQEEAQRRNLETAVATSNRAVEKAEDAQNRRLDLLNEFRRQVSDQSAEFVNRETYDAKHQSLSSRITQIEAAGVGARRALTITFSTATVIATIIAIVISVLIH